MVKVTFTLDDETVATLRRSAERVGKAQSQVVREAVREYADRIGRVGEEERRHLLRVFDEVVPAIPRRPARAADDEIAALRRARRAGGRRNGRRPA